MNLACALFFLTLFIQIVSAARLPIVNSDKDQWGTILNEFLNVTLTENGTLKNNTVSSENIINNTITASDLGLNIIDGAQLADTITLDTMLNIINGNFSINNSDLFVDVSTGNIGIGTLTPSRKLNVIGDINTTGYVYGMTGLCIGTNCKTSWPAESTSPWDNSSTQIFIRAGYPNDINASNTLFINGSSSKIGIGTTSPSGKLEVYGGDIYADIGSDTTRVVGIKGFSSGKTGIFRFSDQYNQLEVTFDGNMKMKGYHAIELIGSSDSNSQDKVLRVKEYTTDRLVINKGGNVGINTTSPTHTLNIVGTSNITGDTYIANNVFVNGSNVGIGTTTPSSILNAVSGVSDFRFSTGASAVTPTMAVINTASNGKAAALIAGTSGSVFSFDSAGFFGIAAESKSAFTENNLGYGTVLLRISSTGGLSLGSYTGTNAAAGNIITSGNIGIGTSSPSYKLDVNGSIRQTNAIDCSLSADANGQIVCAVSSLKYKEKIQNLDFDREKFLSLEPKTFEFKKGLPFYFEGKQIGFIAEDTEKVFPDLVRYNKNLEPEGIKYENLPIYLYQIVKEQQAQINALTNGKFLQAYENKINIGNQNFTQVPELNLENLNVSKTSKIFDLTVENIAKFNNIVLTGNAEIKGHTILNKDSVGETVIKAGTTEAKIEFEQVYDTIPIITITPLEFVDGPYKIEKSISGFKIVLQKPQSKDIAFDWHVFAGNKNVIVSEVLSPTINETNQTSLNKTRVNITQEIEENATK